MTQKNTNSPDGIYSNKEANYNAERTVSEIVEEFKEKWKADEFYSEFYEYEDIEKVTDWLTQALRTERQRCDEMVEEAVQRELSWVKMILGYKHIDDVKSLIEEKLTHPNNPK